MVADDGEAMVGDEDLVDDDDEVLENGVVDEI